MFLKNRESDITPEKSFNNALFFSGKLQSNLERKKRKKEKMEKYCEIVQISDS